MLPTPDTSHVAYERIYEPAEDSFLLLDTLCSESETSFLRSRFFCNTNENSQDGFVQPLPPPPPPPLVVEIGPGSGVVIAFATAHAETIFGTPHVLTAAVDLNPHACAATTQTVRKAVASVSSTSSCSTSRVSAGTEGDGKKKSGGAATFLGSAQGDLTAPLRGGCVDVLIFNPPYVPTPELPVATPGSGYGSVDKAGGREESQVQTSSSSRFAEDSYLLALSYAGGRDGMETTDRLLDSLPRVLSNRGCAYVLLCAQNKPEEVKERVRSLDGGGVWNAETVATSGKKAGWEKLQIIRIWRENRELY